MANLEISSTLKNLKFMQRAAKQRDVKPVEEEPPPEGTSRFDPSAPKRRCIVIMEGNPHPGALRGRMSFQSFNPSIDKLNGAAGIVSQIQTCSNDQIGETSDRVVDGIPGTRTVDSNGASFKNTSNTYLKKNQLDVAMESLPPQKIQRTSTRDGDWQSFSQRDVYKKQKIDWNVFRSQKSPPLQMSGAYA